MYAVVMMNTKSGIFLLCFSSSSLISTFLGGHMLIKQQLQLTKKKPYVTTFPSAYKSAATVNPSKHSSVLIVSKYLQKLGGSSNN